MKVQLFLLACTVVLLSACSGGNDAVRDQAREAVEATQPAQTQTQSPVPPPVDATQPASNNANASASGVKHYICPNNCEGSGGDAQGTCPVCGTAYVHNQAYHAQQQPATPNPIQQQQAPAQNAAGVYHYICSAGCGGGGAAQGTCPSCGAPLTHNQAYHNQ